MHASAFQVAGGLGLFLLGMVSMTRGLEALAGETLRRTLARFTRSPLSGAVTGALTTAAIQSSSATTVTAVGFAGAGLLTFPQALGIVFGANAGTTITGWLVALLGFKVELGQIAFLLVLIGALLRLFGSGRASSVGTALAGFALIFIGIDLLRDGLSGMEGVLTPERFPGDGWSGRLALVGIGAAVTLVTQSSSAGVATAMTALHGGAISFPQAAALVVGMDVGTTGTALLATLGGATQARRTGVAHVVFNLCTAVGALLLLTPYAALAQSWGLVESQPELTLVGFHTLFNVLGVACVLPLARPFAAFIERLIPEHEVDPARVLDTTLVSRPALALDAASRALSELAEQVRVALDEALRPASSAEQVRRRLAPSQVSLRSIRHYLELTRPTPRDGVALERKQHLMHAVDHLRRLMGRARRGLPPRDTPADEPRVRAVERLRAELRRPSGVLSAAALESLWCELRDEEAAFRRATFEASARGDLDSDEALARMDAMRLLQRIAYHAWRFVRHLDAERALAPPGRDAGSQARSTGPVHEPMPPSRL